MARSTKRAGFTFVEILITLAIIAAVVAGVATAGTAWYNRSKDQDAISKASMLDIQKGRYQSENEGVAQVAWAAAATDQAKYALISGYLTMPPMSLGDGTIAGTYTPVGYRMTLNGLSDPTTVTRLGGGQIFPAVGAGINYAVTASSSNPAWGTALGGGTYANGDTVTVNAAPFAGYVFVRWDEGVVQVSTSASYTFTLAANRTLTAVFAAAPAGTYSLTMLRNNAAAGLVTPGSGSQTAGAPVTLGATPNTNWLFSSWTGDIGAANASSSSINVTMDQDRTIQANFVRSAVVLTVVPSNAAWGSVSGGGNIPAGTTTTVTASPFPGYVFVNWLNGAVPVSASASYSPTILADTTLTGVFAPAPVTGVIPGTYGDASTVGQFTVDAQGRILDAQRIPFGKMSLSLVSATAFVMDGSTVGAGATFAGTRSYSIFATGPTAPLGGGYLVIADVATGYYRMVIDAQGKIATGGTVPYAPTAWQTFRGDGISPLIDAQLADGTSAFWVGPTGAIRLAALAGTAGSLQVDALGNVSVGSGGGGSNPTGGFVTSDLALGETATQTFNLPANGPWMQYNAAQAPSVTLTAGKWLVFGNVQFSRSGFAGWGISYVSLCDQNGVAIGPTNHGPSLSGCSVALTPMGVIDVSSTATIRFGIKSPEAMNCTLQRGYIAAAKITSAQLASAIADDYVLKVGDTMTGNLAIAHANADGPKLSLDATTGAGGAKYDFTSTTAASPTGAGKLVIAKDGATKVTVDGNGLSSPRLTASTDGVYFPDGTVQTTAAPRVGSVIRLHSSIPAPAGYLRCDGSVINSASYPNLLTGSTGVISSAIGTITSDANCTIVGLKYANGVFVALATHVDATAYNGYNTYSFTSTDGLTWAGPFIVDANYGSSPPSNAMSPTIEFLCDGNRFMAIYNTYSNQSARVSMDGKNWSPFLEATDIRPGTSAAAGYSKIYIFHDSITGREMNKWYASQSAQIVYRRVWSDGLWDVLRGDYQSPPLLMGSRAEGSSETGVATVIGLSGGPENLWTIGGFWFAAYQSGLSYVGLGALGVSPWKACNFSGVAGWSALTSSTWVGYGDGFFLAANGGQLAYAPTPTTAWTAITGSPFSSSGDLFYVAGSWWQLKGRTVVKAIIKPSGAVRLPLSPGESAGWIDYIKY